MLDQNDVQMAQERYEDYRRQAEIDRLRQERGGNKAPIYAPALARLGKTMVDMGSGLQDRYGDFLPENAPAGS